MGYLVTHDGNQEKALTMPPGTSVLLSDPFLASSPTTSLQHT